MPAKQFDVPTVTVEDFNAFHLRIYGKPAPIGSFPSDHPNLAARHEPNASTEEQYDTSSAADRSDDLYNGAGVGEGGEQDELGYYSDGVKRTLTDQQVAMFRHSEIYAVLRARQLEQEREAEDGDEVDEGSDAFSTTETGGDLNQGSRQREPVVSADKANSSPSARVEERTETLLEASAESDPVGLGKRKRKGSTQETERVRAEISTRGYTRGLDIVTPSEETLDYGNDDVRITGLRADAVENAGSATSEIAAGSEPRGEGRKIWWPVLGNG